MSYYLEGIFIGMIILSIFTYFKLKSRRLRIQALIVGVIAFLGGWAIEAAGIGDGRWDYPESIFYLPGRVPIEIAAVYGLAVPIFFWLIQWTYSTDLDTVTQFGAPELLLGLGFLFWIVDGVFWLTIFAGIAGLVVAPRKKLVLFVGIVAFLTEFFLEGIILAHTGLVIWSGGYPIATPIQFMFVGWFITGYLTSPNTRLVE